MDYKFLLCTLRSAIKPGNVNFYYMPETLATSGNKKIILHLTKKNRNRFKKKARSCLVKQGSFPAWWVQIYKNNFNEWSWKENFRMLKEIFYKLFRKVNLYLAKRQHRWKSYINWLSSFFIPYKQWMAL